MAIFIIAAAILQFSVSALTPQGAIDCALCHTQEPADRDKAKDIVRRLNVAIRRYTGFKRRMNFTELEDNNYRNESGSVWTESDLEYIINQIRERKETIRMNWSL